MDLWDILAAIIALFSPAISALWIWYSTKHLPAKQAREEKEAEDRRLAEGDTREHRQKQEDLELAYHLSENAAVLQVMAELVANAQEGEREANKFIREDVKDDLALIMESVSKLVKAEEQRAKLFTLQNGILSEIGQELRGQQAKITVLIHLMEKGDDG